MKNLAAVSSKTIFVHLKYLRDFQIKKCPKTDAEILSLCTLCLCGSFLRIIYFLEVSKPEDFGFKAYLFHINTYK